MTGADPLSNPVLRIMHMPLEPDGQSQDTGFESAFTDALSAAPPSQQTPTPAVPEAAPQSAAPVAPAVPPAAGQQPVVAPVVPPAAPQLTPYARAAQEAGLPFEGLSDEQIASSMAQHIVRSRPYANYGQQMAPYADQIREYFDGKQQQPPVPAAAAPVAGAAPEPEGWDEEKYFSEKWAAPKWDDQYNFVINQGMVQRNAETGLYEASPGFESMVLEILPGLNKAQSWTAQQWQGITRGNPYRQFYDVLVEPMRNAWKSDMEQIVTAQFERQTSEQRVNRFESENASWLYGVDPQSGGQVLTPKGQAFYNEIATLREGGITDPQMLLQLAQRLISQPQASPAPSPAPPQGTPGIPAPPVPGQPVNPQAASANHQATFLQNALERAAYSPQSGGFIQPAPDHPVSVNETELNNMFVSDYRTAQVPG